MKIFLLGMPGSGKSTIGKLLAANINYPFLDLDKEIERRERKSISEIFESSGEKTFREMETEALREVIQKKGSLVISCGGGTPCFNDNMELMNISGLTVYIDVPEATLVERTKRNTSRPLLQSDHLTKISLLLNERAKFYTMAKYIVPSAGEESVQIAERLPALLGIATKI